MAHNQEMLEHHGAAWGSKVRIIGLSIDYSTKAVKIKVDEKGWNKVEHYQCGKDSNADDEFCVKGVPHVLLVDTEGKIVFKGHPSERPDLAEDIDNLLKGEKLSGISEKEVKGDEIVQEKSSGLSNEEYLAAKIKLDE